MAGTDTPTFEDLVAEVARLRTLVEERPTATAPTPSPAPATGPAPGTGPIDRRAALRKAGMMAAGAVAGGAALTAVTASPAAAATLNGSGAPGVNAVGVGGDGLSASTDTATKSAVYATTSATEAYGVFARHTGQGVAIAAETSSPGSGIRRPTAVLRNLGSGQALLASSATGVAARFEGGATIDAVVEVHPEENPGILVIRPVGAFGTNLQLSGGSLALETGSVTDGLRVSASRSHLILSGGAATAPPARSDSYNRGTIIQQETDLWHCTASGTPGEWRKLSGATTAGAFHVLPAPARVYDSRPGTQPAVGSKTKLAPNVARMVDLRANSSGVPVGATAALLTVLLVNATAGSGNATVWAQGVSRPLANTLVWGGNAGRFTATAVTALDSQGRVQISASLGTDVVIDVVGFYR